MSAQISGMVVSSGVHPSRFSAACARLIDAACCARDGDGETAKAHIAQAVSLLLGQPVTTCSAMRALSATARQITRGSLTAWQARRLTAHIEANLSNKIRIEELASVVNLSQSHFCRVFKSTFGVPAHEYLTRRRVEVAQGWMLTTRESLSEIALNCGMSDQSHFTRSFRRVVGETPDAWRRTRRDALKFYSSELTGPTGNALRV